VTRIASADPYARLFCLNNVFANIFKRYFRQEHLHVPIAASLHWLLDCLLDRCTDSAKRIADHTHAPLVETLSALLAQAMVDHDAPRNAIAEIVRKA
jgi:hypothetical protein